MTYKNRCERCGRVLLGGDPAYVCSYDCTWCPTCAGGFGMKCPNCGGELTQRPRRNQRHAGPADAEPAGTKTQLIIATPTGPMVEEDRGCA